MRRFEKDERLRVGSDGDGRLHIIEIEERLAHAHQHDVRDLALRVGNAAPICGRASANRRYDRSPRGFARRSRPRMRLRTRRCVPVWQKRACQRAADLARNAERAAVGLGDVDGFDFGRTFAGGRREPQQPFSASIFGDLLGGDVRSGKREPRREIRAQRLGEFVSARMSSAPRAYIQFHSCAARILLWLAGTPASASASISSAFVIPASEGFGAGAAFVSERCRRAVMTGK